MQVGVEVVWIGDVIQGQQQWYVFVLFEQFFEYVFVLDLVGVDFCDYVLVDVFCLFVEFVLIVLFYWNMEFGGQFGEYLDLWIMLFFGQL